MWYDVHIMIKTTFAAYKARFKEILTILKPLIIVEFLILILSILGNMYGDGQNYLLIIIGAILIISISFIQIFIYTPATFKTIQKRELGESITIEQAVQFQKQNKWRFFKVTFWIGLYSALYGILSVLPIVIGVGIGIIISTMGGVVGVVVGTLVGLTGIYFGIKLAYRLYPRIFFALNIYLVKDTIGDECVNESIDIGNKHRKEIWGYILGLVGINLIAFLLVMFVLFPTMYPEYMATFANPDVTPEISFGKSTISSVWSTIIRLFFLLPMTYLYMSKAYAKIRAVTEPLVSSIPVNPQATVVTPEIVQ